MFAGPMFTGISAVHSYAYTADAGIDQEIGADGTAQLAGAIGGGASSATWTTDGDGTFDDAGALDAVYTPGAEDAVGGPVVLTLTTSTPPSGTTGVDTLILTVHPLPIVSAGIDQEIAFDGTVQLDGSVAGGATAGLWTTDGDGTFDDDTALDAIYTPGAADIADGTVVLTLTSTDATPCADADDTLVLTITPEPVQAAFADVEGQLVWIDLEDRTSWAGDAPATSVVANRVPDAVSHNLTSAGGAGVNVTADSDGLFQATLSGAQMRLSGSIDLKAKTTFVVVRMQTQSGRNLQFGVQSKFNVQTNWNNKLVLYGYEGAFPVTTADIAGAFGNDADGSPPDILCFEESGGACNLWFNGSDKVSTAAMALDSGAGTFLLHDGASTTYTYWVGVWDRILTTEEKNTVLSALAAIYGTTVGAIA